jgi:hypothetical protein
LLLSIVQISEQTIGFLRKHDFSSLFVHLITPFDSFT